MGNRDEFLKGLRKGIAGALAGATVLAGATGCESRENDNLNENTPTITTTDSNMPIEQDVVGDLTNRLMSMQSKDEVLNFLKEMYINIDNVKNPDNKLNKANLEIYLKGEQTSCFYIESKDAIVLNGQSADRTEQELKETGVEFEKINLKNDLTSDNTFIIVAKNGTTIDGVGSIKDNVKIEEAAITTPGRLSEVTADGKTTAQEFPQQVLEDIIMISEYKKYLKSNPPDKKYIETVTLAELYQKVANDIYEYGLGEYIPEDSKAIEDEGR